MALDLTQEFKPNHERYIFAITLIYRYETRKKFAESIRRKQANLPNNCGNQEPYRQK